MPLVCRPSMAFVDRVATQQELLDHWRELYSSDPAIERKLDLATHTTVEKRHLAPPAASPAIEDRIERYRETALSLSLRAISSALEDAHLTAAEIGCLIVVSCTSPAVLLPGLDAYIVDALPFSPSIRRLPIAQSGCSGGGLGLATAFTHTRAFPDQIALVCAVEVCSVNDHENDITPSNFVSRGLFGDGAAAVVVRGDEVTSPLHVGFEILNTRQYLVPSTLSHMTYSHSSEGNHFRTNREVVPGLKRGFPAVHAFLAENGLESTDLNFIVSHTGGPRVLDAVVSELGIPEDFVWASQASLREVGNLSSASVLDVLARTFGVKGSRRRKPDHGDKGLLIAFGPGSTIEMILGRWRDDTGGLLTPTDSNDGDHMF